MRGPLELQLPPHCVPCCSAAYIRVWMQACLGIAVTVKRHSLVVSEDGVAAIRALFGGSTAAASLRRQAPGTLALWCKSLGAGPAGDTAGMIDAILRVQAAATAHDVMSQALTAAADDAASVEAILDAHRLENYRIAAAQHPVPMPACDAADRERRLVHDALATLYGPAHDPALTAALCAELAYRRA